MPQVLNRILDCQFPRLLRRLSVLQVILVPRVLFLDRRRAAVGVATGRRPTHGQGGPPKGDLIGPTGSQSLPLGSAEVGFQAPVKLRRNEGGPDPAAFSQNRDLALVS